MALESLAAGPKRPAIGIPVYVAAAFAAVGLGVFAYLQYFPSHPAAGLPLSPEGKAYVKNLALSDIKIQATGSFANQTLVEIEGKIGNTGDRAIDVIEIYCVFYDTYGQMVYRPRVPIVSERMGGLKPGETKSFRLPFDEIPDSWNQALPLLVIAGVKFS
ncbi:MAG TPA: FxLYD domain-containing protein [Bryobacteraceae bacterium]